MSKSLKITIIILAVLLFLGIAGVFISNAVVHSKIETLLTSSLPQTLKVEYKEIDVSTLNGSIAIISPKITNTGKTTHKINSHLEMDTLLIDDFGYWDYLFNDKIHIESIQLRHPKMTYYHNKLVDKKEYKYSKLEQLKQNILVNRVNIQNGEFIVHDVQTDSLLLKTENFTANMMDVELNEHTVKRRIPFLYDDYNVHFDNLFFQLSAYESLTIKSSKITKKESTFNKLKLYTKYSKQELTRIISVERDHYDISINSIVLEQQDFGYRQDSLFYFRVPKVVFNQPEMAIYRNKLVADDNTIKPLYSKMLRNLKFDLTVDEVNVEDAVINYSEKVKVDAGSGEIQFSKLNANIKNVSNTYVSPEKTTLDIQAVFMGQTPIDVQWNFDVNDVNDHFMFKAEVGKLDANKMNKFSEPNLKVRLEGGINKVYFTIDGYDNDSNVDLKLNYDDFKVTVLNKDGKKENKFLSAIANIFIKKDSNKEVDNFRNGTAKVERNKTKSVFNFLWLNASGGLLNAMTGSGKEK